MTSRDAPMLLWARRQLNRLLFWRSTPNQATDDGAAVGNEVDGCFTLPGATLDQLGPTPVGGPEDSREPDDFS
jgi:hypothetical protein